MYRLSCVVVEVVTLDQSDGVIFFPFQAARAGGGAGRRAAGPAARGAREARAGGPEQKGVRARRPGPGAPEEQGAWPPLFPSRPTSRSVTPDANARIRHILTLLAQTRTFYLLANLP